MKKKGKGVPVVDIADPWAGESLFDRGVEKALGKASKGSKSSHGAYSPKCAHSHPALTFKGPDGAVYSVYGGSASSPLLESHDIYVALDWGVAHDPKAYPWYGNSRTFIHYPVQDMSVPNDPADFKLMIKWLVGQIKAGKNVHVGCIGGHGRTGMVLAAIAADLGEEDAIAYVRANYCKKAVENDKQVQWLVKHFGVKPAAGSKQWAMESPASTGVASGWGNLDGMYPAMTTSRRPSGGMSEYLSNKPKHVGKTYTPEWPQTVEVKPFKVKGNIWGTTELTVV